MVALLLSTCVACIAPAPSVHTEHNPGASFAGARTYDWVTDLPETDPATRSEGQILAWRFRNAVDAQLANKGFRRGGRGRADFLVDYHVTRQEKVSDSVGGYMDYLSQGGTGSAGDAFVTGYEQGTLTLEILDGPSKRLAWRAWVSRVSGSAANPGVLEGVAQEMLKDFPPR